MHIRKSEAALLKIDLKKAYHCIDCGFLKCLLYKIGLNENCTNWIMACVVDVNYAVLVNGIPSSYFTAARGLRQGCSLSPLLFILVMDTPSLHIQKAMKEKRCNPLKLCRGISVSHNLFVDDILLSAMLCRDSWICLHVILGKFQKATGLCINVDKSSFHLEDVNMEIDAFLTNLFNIKVSPLCVGLKYLGYKLEPVGYSSADWLWILDRYYKRIAGWEFKCLSLAGWAILTQTVLVQLMVYGAHLFYIPSIIISKLNRITANFIWGGNQDHRRFHLTKLSHLTRPKKLGGYGIMNLHLFRNALLCKSLWRGVMEDSLWSKAREMTFWYRQGTIGLSHGSAIWRSFRKIEHFFLKMPGMELSIWEKYYYRTRSDCRRWRGSFYFLAVNSSTSAKRDLLLGPGHR